MTWYHHHWKVYSIGKCEALQVIIALGHHTRSYDFGRDMPAWPIGSTHGWITSGVGCHQLLLTAYMVRRRLVWHAISPLDSTHGKIRVNVKLNGIKAFYHKIYYLTLKLTFSDVYPRYLKHKNLFSFIRFVAIKN